MDVSAAEDPDRLRALVRERLGRTPARIDAVPAGLGTRRFHRLHFDDGAPRTLIARVEPGPSDPSAPPARPSGAAAPEPPPWLPEPALEPLRGFLEAEGLPVPASHGHWPDVGIDLLEDVGDVTLLDVPPGERAARYREAAALLPSLQRLEAPPDAIPAFGRRYDATLVATKAWKWLHWTIPLLLGREATADEREATRRLFDHIAAIAAESPLRLAHRDFKAENLHLVLSPDRAAAQREAAQREAAQPEFTDGGARRLVMIDVQGAFVAPPEYDLACLLHDIQVDLPESLVEEVVAAVRPQLPDRPDAAVSGERLDALAIARLCKDVAHVVHAARVRGDGRRWADVPRGLERLRRLAGRREHTFPGARGLTSVIEALTTTLDPADSPS